MLRGEVTIGELAFLAVERHYRDLLTGSKRGLTFSPGHAWHVIGYIEKYFVHLKGSLGGAPMLLDPWQRFWTAVLYGWLKADGTRRFNIGYEEVARKNGKSTWKSAQGGYLFMMDREPGAEVYSIATTRDQAMAVFAVALANFKRWCRLSKKIERSFAIHDGKNQEQILYGDASVFRPLPANADSLDGKNPHAILFDELHAQKTSDVWDVMVSAFGSRVQWLLTAITTAGFILDGICMDQRNYLVSILKGDRVDDAFFGYVYTLDEGDDVFDEANWVKANPGLGSSKMLSYMQSMAKQARALPSALANFKTKDLNLWVNSADGWLDKAVWEKGGKRFDPLMLRGRRCFGGSDLSSTQDLTAFALVFPPADNDPEWYVLVWTYCPRSKVINQADDMAPYAKWEKAGHLTVTEGDVVDYKPMSKQIQLAAKHYDLVELAYDKWNSTHLMNELDDAGIPLVEVPQRFEGMFPGSKLLEMLVYGKHLRHNANPVLQSAAMNVSLLYDTNGNFRPDKKKSMQKGRIDPIVAVVMALSRAWVHNPQDMSGFTSNPIMVGI